MTDIIFREMVNGSAITPELIYLVLLTIYLSKESRRRGLRALDWFKLPPSMSLVLAMFIFDLGITIRSTSIWIWLRFYSSTDLGMVAPVLLFGGVLTVVGMLCKIRALTEPDHGNGPWALSALSTAAVIIALIVLR